MAGKSKRDTAAGDLLMPAGGLEAEFTLVIDDRPVRPEDVFGDPRAFLRVPLLHRTGRSFHLPNGAAIYFDTGVIEIATPAMELDRGCFLRLSRSLHEALRLVREQLDAWERRSGRRVRLQGFSTHYNVSAGCSSAHHVSVDAWTLAHILPAPVMLLATNRLSTGVGVRPRRRRVEVTVDYSPDPMRVAATGALIAGIVNGTGTWPRGGLAPVRGRGIPIVNGFAPMRHTSRHGWLARFDCFPLNPFACDADTAAWHTTAGRLTLREVARRIADVFDAEIRAVADPASYRLARRILSGQSASWLDEDARPAAYDDAGRASDLASLERAGMSRYERVLRDAVSGRPVKLEGEWWVPVRVRGWSLIVLRRERDGTRVTRSIDQLMDRVTPDL